MALFEIETDAHIMIAWADDQASAEAIALRSYPDDHVKRVAKRPHDVWVISKRLLGIEGTGQPCDKARDCLSRSKGDKVHAIRLYMHETGTDLERSRKVIESNMVMGW